jgi:hypothetical protein
MEVTNRCTWQNDMELGLTKDAALVSCALHSTDPA